jgi:uncharacterized protein YjbI with pentapeptide repeats/beta-lactamase regulating signal transducer with metallopeptidase domain
MFDWQQGFVTFASAIAATVLNALWQDALLVLCVWLLLRAWPKINAATRYVVWSATLAAAFVVPVATTLPFFTAPQAIAASNGQRSAQEVFPVVGATTRHERLATRAVATRPIAPSSESPRLPERVRVILPVPVALGVFALWLLLAAYALVRLAIGLARLEQLKRDALPLPVEYRDAMPQWLRANKGARDVRLCVSDETDVPVAVGLFDAMILIPRSLLERLSEPEVDQICLHELAHLRRADDWTNGVQRIISALLGWNPAAQFIGQQLDLEREVACDDWVLSFVGMVRPYALCLTKMAESATWPHHAIPAPGVFATRKHISLRIERLLGAGRNIATNFAIAPAAAAVAVVGAIGLVIAVVAPSVAAPCVTSVTVASAAKYAQPATSAKPGNVVSVPATHVSVPATHVSVPATRVSAPATRVSVPATRVSVPAMHVSVPATQVTVPATHMTVPEIHVDVPGFSMGIASSVAQSASSSNSGRSCDGCDFGRVDWSGRDMHGVNYIGVDLSKSKLVGTNFSGGNFNGVDFRQADLRNASFRNAHLVGCDFSNADLTGVDFSGARLSGCQFTGAQLSSSELRDVLNSCTGCDFTRASLNGVDLSNVRANGDDFSGADLRGVNFAGAQLTGIDFSKAHLDGANLAGATLNGCDLSGVDLRRVDLSKTKMIGMDFSNKQSP